MVCEDLCEHHHATSLVLIHVSALSDARLREEVKLGEVLCARSIKPFEWSRPRLRPTRAAMGIAWMEGAVETWAGSAQRSGTANRSRAIAARQVSWHVVEEHEG